MTSPKISVIVPIYKAEQYLHRCIQSIISQTFTEFEALLIDDGSPDMSGEICDYYSSIDKRFKVIHKNNEGVSSARQCGLNYATGEYVIHMDPDDYADSTMLEELYQFAWQNDSDMVICDFYKHIGENCEYISQQPSSLASQDVLNEMLFKLHGACWNKLVRRSCFTNFNIEFPLQFSLHEDLYVTLALLKEHIRISYYSKAFYHYIISDNNNSISTTTTYSEKIYQEDINKLKIFCELMNGHLLYNDVKKLISTSIVSRAYYSGYFSTKEFKNKMICYRNDIAKFKYIPISTKVKLYASCSGFYCVFKFLTDIQNLIKSQ